LKRWVVFFLWAAIAGCGSAAEVDFARSLAVKAPADWVFRGGKIVTVDQRFAIREAVAIRDGRILAVGSDRDMRPLMGPRTRVIDLAGRTVIPGLIDSHIHATVAGSTWDAELHWEFARTLKEGLEQIGRMATTRPPGSWIVVGGGWVPGQFAERRLPNRAELDRLAPNHPVYLQYLDEAALLNGAALAALGITSATPDPPEGKFGRDPKTGALTGWLQGAPAWQYAYRQIPRPTLDQVRQSLRHCFRELNRRGITSISDLHTDGVDFSHRRVLADMARAGELPLRVNFYVAPNEPADMVEQLERAAAEIKGLGQSEFFRFAGIALNPVRAIDSPDRSSTSLDESTREEFLKAARFAAERGYQLHVYAGQDQTARQLLDLLEQIDALKPLRGRRMAFAGLHHVAPETVVRIQRLGGAIAVQSRLALAGERHAEIWGPEESRQAPPLGAMIETGISLGAGSDAFRAGNYSPMLTLWWLITGKTVAGSAERDARHNLTREQALRMHTMGSAWLTFEEGRKGSIEAGKHADLVVLNGDYLTVPEGQIRDLESLLTMVGGRVVYAAEPFAP
jgi:predicted amidohydrolase YtcJ